MTERHDDKSERQARALAMLREMRGRDIYIGRDGWYYVSYSEGKSPRLSRGDVDEMLERGQIVMKYEGFYEIRD
jgi:hypothetical protein